MGRHSALRFSYDLYSMDATVVVKSIVSAPGIDFRFSSTTFASRVNALPHIVSVIFGSQGSIATVNLLWARLIARSLVFVQLLMIHIHIFDQVKF